MITTKIQLPKHPDFQERNEQPAISGKRWHFSDQKRPFFVSKWPFFAPKTPILGQESSENSVNIQKFTRRSRAIQPKEPHEHTQEKRALVPLSSPRTSLRFPRSRVQLGIEGEAQEETPLRVRPFYLRRSNSLGTLKTASPKENILTENVTYAILNALGVTEAGDTWDSPRCDGFFVKFFAQGIFCPKSDQGGPPQ